MSKVDDLRARSNEERSAFYRILSGAGCGHAPSADRLAALVKECRSRLVRRKLTEVSFLDTAPDRDQRVVPGTHVALPAAELVGIIAELHDLRHRMLAAEAALLERQEQDGSLGPNPAGYRAAVRALVEGAKQWRLGFERDSVIPKLIDDVMFAERMGP